VERLLGDAPFSADTALREATLDGLVYLVRHGTVDATFAAALDARVAELFGEGQARLRSSTNAEDLPGFSGAGLYESFGAFATGDDRASQEIRKVWGSTWTFRAFEERQFWNVDQRGIRMGVAVSTAFDDEAVNGVLVTRNLQSPGSPGYYVNVQEGEVEVTNPENGALPEIFSIVPGTAGEPSIVRQRYSSLSPGSPLMTEAEIGVLDETAARVVSHFAPLYGEPAATLALDLEFKLTAPDRHLVVKQTRPYAVLGGS
jgi:pyruvate,water dikinase